MEAMGGNGWQQQKQRMCIDQVQNQRTTKEETSCTMHMHFTCVSLVVHIKLERSSCSLSVTFCCCLCPSLAHRFTLFTLSLAGSWCGEFFLVFFLCNGQSSICSKQKKRSPVSNIGKRCVKPFKNRSVCLCGHPNTSIGSRYLDVYTNRLMSFYIIVPMSFGACNNHRSFIFTS